MKINLLFPYLSQFRSQLIHFCNICPIRAYCQFKLLFISQVSRKDKIPNQYSQICILNQAKSNPNIMFNDSLYQQQLPEFNSQTTSPGTYLLLSRQIKISQESLLKQIFQLISGIYQSEQSRSNHLQQLTQSSQELRVFKKGDQVDAYSLNKNIAMKHLKNQTIKNALSNCIKFANQLSYISTQLLKLYAESNSLVRNFCEGAFDFLAEVRHNFGRLLAQVTYIESSEEDLRISLLSIERNIIQHRNPAQMVLKCVNACLIKSDLQPKSIVLLDKLWQIDKQIIVYPITQQKVFMKIFLRTLQSYLRLIKQYLMMKNVSQNNDFFIFDFEHKPISGNRHKLLIPEGYLQDKDQIIDEKLPVFLNDHVRAILEIGKTIRFISQYYEPHEIETLLQYFNVNGEFETIDAILQQWKPSQMINKVKIQKKSMNERLKERKKKVYLEVKKVPDDNPYQIFTPPTGNFEYRQIQKITKYIQQNSGNSPLKNENQESTVKVSLQIKNNLSQILQNLNKKCLVFFQKHEQSFVIPSSLSLVLEGRIQASMTQTLVGLKKFMLLEQGDFLEEFFNSAQGILDEKKGLVTHNKIFNCIQEAIKNSSARSINEEIVRQVHFDFIRFGSKETENLKLWLVFCFRYQLQGPISHIFTNQMMEQFKGVNNLIFCIKKGQILLNSFWQRPHEAKMNQLRQKISPRRNNKLSKRKRVLRNSLQVLLNSLLSYLTYNIDFLWNQYLQSLESCVTIFQIVEQSQNITKKLYYLAITDKVFHNVVMMSLKLIQKFRRFCTLVADPTILIHITEVEDMEFELRGIIEIAAKVEGLRGVVDFNEFYYRAD